MLTIAILIASPFSAPNSSELAHCRATSTFVSSSGSSQVVSNLYRSCLLARGIEAADARFNPWVPSLTSCEPDTTPLQKMAADLAHGCRLEALYEDSSGMIRVHSAEVRACMKRSGFTPTRPRAVETWMDGCDPMVARSTQMSRP